MKMHFLPWVWLGSAYVCGASLATAQDALTREIKNPLGLNWPGELVHFDLPAENMRDDMSVQCNGETRPAQVEKIERDGKKMARLWFIATLKGAQGKSDPGDRAVAVKVVAGKTASPLTLKTEGDVYVITNGHYAARVPAFKKFVVAPAGQVPTILGGVKRTDDPLFFGKSAFVGDAKIVKAETQVLAAGPVFIDLKVTYVFAEGLKTAVPLPRPKYDRPQPVQKTELPPNSYTAVLRFVVGDPWIDITEKCNFEGELSYQFDLHENLKPDTAMFVPWFSYEAFGGNSALKYAKLEPRPKQRGPFLSLRPRWSQMPGGGMDFFVTTGGVASRPKDEPEATPLEIDPTAPAVGVIATNPIKWINPYAQTITIHCENGDQARADFPISSGGRSYAILCGSRGEFDGAGKLNSLVRRHTDWTLDAQINQYILDWPRKPELAGPHILMTRAELERLQTDYQAGRDTPEMRILKGYEAKKEELSAWEKDLLTLFTTGRVENPPLPGAQAWLSQRYQEDTLNPTSPSNRRIAPSLAKADLAANGQPIGDAWTAAIGYIFSDLNQWPGYHNGWDPGNPNFHTDKYRNAIYVGAAMLDHPHAAQWIGFGQKTFEDDLSKVFLAPDGVGYECPGYSGYSLRLQVETAKVLKNVGRGDPVVDYPLIAKSLVWHRHLLTPFDVRLGLRHEVPIGDTHRWTSGATEAFGRVAKLIKHSNPPLASEFMGIWKLLREEGLQGSLMEDLIDVDQTIPATPVEKMEWGSHAFYGFGSVMRSRFGTPRETFVTFKAGPARGHYHNDELSFHFYGEGTPLSLDYNSSYHPRADHAALHNTMTFGVAKSFTHVGENEQPVEALEQLIGVARVGAFASTPVADVCVAEMTGDTLTLTPTYPDDAKYRYSYPTRKTSTPIVHRRSLILVKHGAESKLADYLAVRDETQSPEPQQLNLHLLARDVKRDGPIIRAAGQWDTDAVVYLGDSKVKDFKVGRSYYYDESMIGPEIKEAKIGKKINPADALAKTEWRGKIHDSDGEVLIPPLGHQGQWKTGEYQKWLQIGTTGGTPMLWILYPKKAGAPEPTFETLLDGQGVRVTLGSEVDEIYANTIDHALRGQVEVTQNGKKTILLDAGAVPALGKIPTASPTVLQTEVDPAMPEKR